MRPVLVALFLATVLWSPFMAQPVVLTATDGRSQVIACVTARSCEDEAAPSSRCARRSTCPRTTSCSPNATTPANDGDRGSGDDHCRGNPGRCVTITTVAILLDEAPITPSAPTSIEPTTDLPVHSRCPLPEVPPPRPLL